MATVGGDDFDIVLSEHALEAAGVDADSLTQAELFSLYEECRHHEKKVCTRTRAVSQ